LILGILSLFCAQAGAKKVYAVEASKMANIALENVTENKVDDVIEVNTLNSQRKKIVL